MFFLIFINLLFFINNIFASNILENIINIKTENCQAGKLLFAVLDKSDQELFNIAKLASSAISKTKQFDITVNYFDKLKNKNEIKELFDKEFFLVVFLEHANNNQAIEYRIYDSRSVNMIKGKRIFKKTNILRSVAYNLADEIWSAITLKPGSFSSKIAYIKRQKDNYGRSHSIICVCDFDGSNITKIADFRGTYIGLYWNNNSDTPLIFASEFTPYNVKLVKINLNGYKSTVLDINGTCVGISFGNKNTAVYCKSGEIWSYFYDEITKKSTHSNIIKNDGKNISPILLENGDIIFCSDSANLFNQTCPNNLDKKRVSRNPKIYYFNNSTKKVDIITPDGYCVDPSYCAYNKKIAYSKRVNNILQLFIYDCNTKKHEQITFDHGNKINSSWSSCGSYLVFCQSAGKSSKIGIINTILKDINFITNPDDFAISPSWSSAYYNNF